MALGGRLDSPWSGIGGTGRAFGRHRKALRSIGKHGEALGIERHWEALGGTVKVFGRHWQALGSAGGGVRKTLKGVLGVEACLEGIEKHWEALGSIGRQWEDVWKALRSTEKHLDLLGNVWKALRSIENIGSYWKAFGRHGQALKGIEKHWEGVWKTLKGV